MTYSFAVGVLVHMHVRCCVYTHEWMYVRKHRAYVHLNMHKEYTFHFAGRQLRILNTQLSFVCILAHAQGLHGGRPLRILKSVDALLCSYMHRTASK